MTGQLPLPAHRQFPQKRWYSPGWELYRSKLSQGEFGGLSGGSCLGTISCSFFKVYHTQYSFIMCTFCVCCLFVFPEMIYLLGGWDGFKDLGDFWSYNINTNHWKCISGDTTEQVNLNTSSLYINSHRTSDNFVKDHCKIFVKTGLVLSILSVSQLVFCSHVVVRFEELSLLLGPYSSLIS